MLYATKDAGAAVGEIVAALSERIEVKQVEIRLTQDSLVTLLHISESAEKCEKPAETKQDRRKRKFKIKRSKVDGKAMIECDGERLSIMEWANKLGMTDSGIRYRVEKYGNPYGRKSPSDSDKVITG